MKKKINKATSGIISVSISKEKEAEAEAMIKTIRRVTFKKETKEITLHFDRSSSAYCGQERLLIAFKRNKSDKKREITAPIIGCSHLEGNKVVLVPPPEAYVRLGDLIWVVYVEMDNFSKENGFIVAQT